MEDPQLEQLKELIRQNIALSQETNKIVHHMRNAARIRSFMWWLFVLASIGLSLWSYFTFVEPRIVEITSFYNQNAGQAQSLWQGANDFFKNFSGTSTSSQRN